MPTHSDFTFRLDPTDVIFTNVMREFGLPGIPKRPLVRESDIKRVIFNNRITIILWVDGSKTVVRCQPEDSYSPEAGVAIAIMKKVLGNKGNFNEVLKRLVNGAKRGK